MSGTYVQEVKIKLNYGHFCNFRGPKEILRGPKKQYSKLFHTFHKLSQTKPQALILVDKFK